MQARNAQTLNTFTFNCKPFLTTINITKFYHNANNVVRMRMRATHASPFSTCQQRGKFSRVQPILHSRMVLTHTHIHALLINYL